MKIEEKFNQKLLVEGNDDQHVIWSICDKNKVTESFDIIDCGSDSQLLRQLSRRIRFNADKVKAIGILLDADTSLQKRWNEIKKQVKDLGYALPDVPDANGTIIESSSYYPRLGIWLMPDNLQSSGMLEDFAKVLIPEQDQLLVEVERVLSEIEAIPRKAIYKDVHKAKALIHTWLAWQEDPGTPMGLAITKSYLNHNHELAIRFVTWLNALFNPTTNNQ
ncbi:DUF3226 domain-containing protein [Siphonobacter sp. SORGH_AS_1065]|uniref:DUF3226 domain-containing protein n=1 Tax=Siphonobacter sp. SORGH_AS_1065 TaxID=3041795 RepID=UPI002780FB4A|nr:DUF3226 domain-containing protein [Siphonobacter sp. SORGH_AS_1065]MDQ1088089.1 5S rRNA maturation endonuclease (ribonuclease M5) [Siphonobacter sp. SORGH_AS_1065]